MDVSLRRAAGTVAILTLIVSGCGDGLSLPWAQPQQVSDPAPVAAATNAAEPAKAPPASADTLAEVEAFLARLQRMQSADAAESPGRQVDAGARPPLNTWRVADTPPQPDAPRAEPSVAAPAVSNASVSIDDPALPEVTQAAPVVRFVGVVTPEPALQGTDGASRLGANTAAAAIADERSLTLAEYADALRENRLGLTEVESAWRLLLLEMVRGMDPSATALHVSTRHGDVVESFAELSRLLHDALSDPLGRWDEALAGATALRDRVAAAADLSIPTLLLCSEVRSFGNYETMPADQFLAGQSNRMIVYCEVENFHSRLNEAGLHETTLATRIEVFDAVSGASVWSQEQPEIVDTCRRRRADFFLAQRAVLPATLAEGRYVLKMTVEDTQAGRLSEQTLDLEVRSPASLAAGN